MGNTAIGVTRLKIIIALFFITSGQQSLSWRLRPGILEEAVQSAFMDQISEEQQEFEDVDVDEKIPRDFKGELLRVLRKIKCLMAAQKDDEVQICAENEKRGLYYQHFRKRQLSNTTT